MSTIKDIAELLSQLSKIVKDTRSILKAITDGKEFLARKFPNSSKDFSKLLLQMEITIDHQILTNGMFTGWSSAAGPIARLTVRVSADWE